MFDNDRLSLFVSKFPYLYGAEGDNPEGGAGTGEGGEIPKEGAGASDSSNGDPQRKIAALQEEKDRHYQARQQEQEKREAAERKLQELEDKGKSEGELKDRELQQLKERVPLLEKQLNDLRINNAFLTTNDIQWHNPERALSLVDLSNVQIDKDGKVDTAALKSAIKALADSDSYLVKPSEPKEERQAPPPGSGQVPAPQRGKQAAPNDVLAAKYPALRSHRR